MRTLEDAHSLTRPTGRLVGFEPLEGNDRGPLLIGVEALDGRFWTARVARAEDLRVLQGVERGAIVCLHRAPPQLRPSDRTILEIAGEDRIYSADRHRAAAPSDRESYIRMHERRLEALRMDGIVERDGLGRFHLPRDFEAQVLVREGRGGRESARVQLLDPHALRTQRDYLGPTWLDRVLDGQEHLAEPAQTGFGREMREHLVGREEHLSGLGLLEAGGVLVEDWRDQLEALERKTILDRLERETGRVSHFAREGEKVHGIYVGRVLAGEGSFALIQQERTATLAPWRPELERARNQVIVGRVEGPQFDFQMGRAAEKAIGKGIDLWR